MLQWNCSCCQWTLRKRPSSTAPTTVLTLLHHDDLKHHRQHTTHFPKSHPHDTTTIAMVTRQAGKPQTKGGGHVRRHLGGLHCALTKMRCFKWEGYSAYTPYGVYILHNKLIEVDGFLLESLQALSRVEAACSEALLEYLLPKKLFCEWPPNSNCALHSVMLTFGSRRAGSLRTYWSLQRCWDNLLWQVKVIPQILDTYTTATQNNTHKSSLDLYA